MRIRYLLILAIVAAFNTQSALAEVTLKPTLIDNEVQKIRYDLSYRSATDNSGAWFASNDEFNNADAFTESGEVKLKSPMKAFLFSLVVPGLGQLYNGSRIKPVAFIGAEAAAWGLYFKWHGDGNDKTTEFEAYQRTHWSRTSYEQKYLLWAYGVTDDDSLQGVQYSEVTHHLPDGETQQYFEMTGKYDQFLWGWDDAFLVNANGDTTYLSDYGPPPNEPPRINGGPDNTPHSDRRLFYEGMRKDANDSFDRANRMVIVSMLNHVVSAFEAFFAARRHNRGVINQYGTFGSVRIRPSVQSRHKAMDTPYVKLAVRF